MTSEPAPRDPEAIIGYLDEDGCLIPITNWLPGYAFHGQPVPDTYTIVREKDINDNDWRVTI